MTPELIVYCGDFLTESARMADGSVQCCVTSPPYFSCRDYHIEPSAWPKIKYRPLAGLRCQVTVPEMECCLGLEESLAAYVGHIVHVFRIVRRLLRDDGVCWINLGDTMSGGGFGGGGCLGKNWAKVPDVPNNGHKTPPRMYADNPARALNNEAPWRQNGRRRFDGFKDKDLMGVPWRCAMALQADGWYLRMDNIWAKDNPMPESAPDRPTKAHEYIFLVAKKERYFYDREAVREPQTGNAHDRGKKLAPSPDALLFSEEVFGTEGTERTEGTMRGVTPKSRPDRSDGVKANHIFHAATSQFTEIPGGRNMRSVWRMKVMPFSGPHTATFPPELAQRCILAGTSEGGCCATCGTPLTRILEKGEPDLEWRKKSGGDAKGSYEGKSNKNYQSHGAQDASAVKKRILDSMVAKRTVGWRKGCKCAGGQNDFVDGERLARVKPCLVLDPFLGSGTTAKVALELGRSFVGTEKNPNDMEWIRKRASVTLGLGI